MKKNKTDKMGNYKTYLNRNCSIKKKIKIEQKKKRLKKVIIEKAGTKKKKEKK